MSTKVYLNNFIINLKEVIAIEKIKIPNSNNLKVYLSGGQIIEMEDVQDYINFINVWQQLK